MAHYYNLIEKVTQFFNIKEKLKLVRYKNEEAFKKPFITIAREPGSGGAPIARAVANKLGFEFIDEQIVDEIAHSTQKRKAIISAVDEKSRTNIQDIIHSVLNTEYIDDTTYIFELVKVVLAHAHQGNKVILGRGANFITPFAKGLHVNIVAPYKTRVQMAMDFEGHSSLRAKEVIAEVEAERSNFVKQYFKKDINNPYYYDLIINTAHIGVDQARDTIIKAFNLKFGGGFRAKML